MEVKVQALSGFKFNGAVVEAGDIVDVPKGFAAQLVADSKAVYAVEKPKPQKLSTKTAAALVG